MQLENPEEGNPIYYPFERRKKNMRDFYVSGWSSAAAFSYPKNRLFAIDLPASHVTSHSSLILKPRRPPRGPLGLCCLGLQGLFANCDSAAKRIHVIIRGRDARSTRHCER